MKRLNLILLLFVVYTVYGQRPHQRAKKILIDTADWITNDLEGSLTFYKNDGVTNSLKGRAVAEFGIYAATGKFQVVKDTLAILHEYYGADNFDTSKQRHTERICFLIKHLDKEKLVLVPVGGQVSRTKLAKGEMDSTDYVDYAGRVRPQLPEYHFQNLKYAADRSFEFNKIYFKAGPGLTVQIDNKGIYYLCAENFEDKQQNGYFKGNLTSEQLDTLNDLLQRSQLRKMRDWPAGRFSDGGTEYDLQVDYDGGQLAIETDTLPITIHGLIAFLEESYKKITLVPLPLDRIDHNLNLIGNNSKQRYP